MRVAKIVFSAVLAVGLAGSGMTSVTKSAVPQYELAMLKLEPSIGTTTWLSPISDSTMRVSARSVIARQGWSGAERDAAPSTSTRVLDRWLMVLICVGLVVFQLQRSHRSLETRFTVYDP